jgi:hypothetical protein
VSRALLSKGRGNISSFREYFSTLEEGKKGGEREIYVKNNFIR